MGKIKNTVVKSILDSRKVTWTDLSGSWDLDFAGISLHCFEDGTGVLQELSEQDLEIEE